MDRDHFDSLMRALAGGTTRRRIGSLLALGIGTAFGASGETGAKRRKKRKRNRKKKDTTSPCQPTCSGKVCGPDGCGGSCGTCVAPLVCRESSGQCIESEDTCGQCPGGLVCNDGSCCNPNCDDRVCGMNECGSSCGSCPIDKPVCIDNGYACAPIPDWP